MQISEPTSFSELYKTWKGLYDLSSNYEARMKRVRQRAQGLVKRAVNKAIKDLGGPISYRDGSHTEELRLSVCDASYDWSQLKYYVEARGFFDEEEKKVHDFLKKVMHKMEIKGLFSKKFRREHDDILVTLDPQQVEIDLD